MIRVLQGNMNQARRAGDLLEQIAREEDADILLLGEQSHNMNHEHWYSDDTDYCAIWPKRPWPNTGKGIAMFGPHAGGQLI